MPVEQLALLSTRPDTLTAAACPLRVHVRVEVEPALPQAELVALLSDAVEAAIAHGQRRYGLYRDELPLRARAVEEAARAVVDDELGRRGHRLRQFAVISIELA